MAKFFFSFAGVDHDGDMERFCGELFDAVAQSLGGRLKRGDVAFLYTNAIAPGEQWPAALIDALAECKVFLYARSPNYFGTEACGQEWSCFAARLAQGDEKLMVPICWVPLRHAKLTLPQPIVDAYLGPEKFGAEYYEHGLKRIMFKRDEAAYRNLLSNLCDYLCQLINDAQFELSELDRSQDFRKLPNAFLPAVAPSGSTRVEDTSDASAGTGRLRRALAAEVP
jgi:hypothetical protein